MSASIHWSFDALRLIKDALMEIYDVARSEVQPQPLNEGGRHSLHEVSIPWAWFLVKLLASHDKKDLYFPTYFSFAYDMR